MNVREAAAFFSSHIWLFDTGDGYKIVKNKIELNKENLLPFLQKIQNCFLFKIYNYRLTIN